MCGKTLFKSCRIFSYIDMFLAEQEAKRGSYFTDEDLIINCQERHPFVEFSQNCRKMIIYRTCSSPDLRRRARPSATASCGWCSTPKCRKSAKKKSTEWLDE